MIYFYYGEDDLSIKRQVDAVKAAFSEKYGAENISQINATDTGVDTVLSELVNVGLFSANRLVILNGVFANKVLSEKLADILPRIHDQTDVVIVEPKPDKRLKVYKLLTKDYKSKEFALGRDSTGFALQEAARQGVEINRAGADELVNYTSGDRWRIASELEKLAGLNQPITPELVRQYVEPELQASAFGLLDDLLAGRRDKALAELAKLRRKEDANRFFGLMASQVFALSAVVEAGGKTPNDIAKDIGLHPYTIQKLSTMTSRISKSAVKRYSKVMSETDQKIKSSKTEAWELIKLAILKF